MKSIFIVAYKLCLVLLGTSRFSSVIYSVKQVQVLLFTCFDLQFHLIFLCRDIYFVVEVDIPSVGKLVILFRDDIILDADYLLDCHTSNFLENLGCLLSYR